MKCQPFRLDVPVDHREYSDGVRPTVVAVVRTGESLLLVLPKVAGGNGYIFPQGPINLGQTPQAACIRILEEECSIGDKMIESTVPFGLANKSSHHGDRENVCRLVFVSLRPHFVLPQPPAGGIQNLILVNGPNHLWQKIADCSVNRRGFMAKAVRSLIQQRLLVTGRWQLERLEPFLRYAAE